MNAQHFMLKSAITAVAVGVALSASRPTLASDQTLQNVDIATLGTIVASDVASWAPPTTSCVSVSDAILMQTSQPLNSVCLGVLAVPDNSSKVLNSLLAAKAMGSKVTIRYDYTYSTTAPGLRCPALGYTPCAVVGVLVKP